MSSEYGFADGSVASEELAHGKLDEGVAGDRHADFLAHLLDRSVDFGKPLVGDSNADLNVLRHDLSVAHETDRRNTWT